MTRTRLNSLVTLVAIVSMLAFGVHTSRAAGDEHRGQIRIVTVDDDGIRHEETIELDGDRTTAFLGVNLGRPNDGDGALVEGVIDGSPAERAGFADGDVIIRFDGRSIDGPGDLMERVWDADPGSDVQVEVLRDGKRQTIDVELGEKNSPFHFMGGDFGGDFHFNFDMGDLHAEMEKLHEQLEGLDLDIRIPDINIPDLNIRVPDFQHFQHGFTFSSKPKLGVQLVETTPELREHLGGSADVGVLVGKVLTATPAQDAGVQVGDLIVGVDGQPIEDAGDLIRALRNKTAETISLELIRDGRETSLDVFIPEVEEDRDDDVRFGTEPASWRTKT